MILDLLGNFLRAGANKVTTSSLIKTWNSKIQAPNGGTLGIFCKEIYHTTTAAATNTLSTTAVPDGALLFALSGVVLVPVVIGTNRSHIDITVGSTEWIVISPSVLTFPVGTTFKSSTEPTQVAADTDITLTPHGGTGGNLAAGGVIRFQLWYLLATAPTGS